MRVLHVFKWYNEECRGGIEKVIQQLIAATAGLGVSNSVLCIAGHGQRPGTVRGRAGERIHRYAESFSCGSIAGSLGMLTAFRRKAAEQDLIHYHFPFPQQDLMHLLLRPAPPALLSYHSDIVRPRWLYPFYTPLMNAFFARLDALVASSPQYFDSSPVLQRFKDKTTVIPYGLDERSYPPPCPDNQGQWRRRLGEGFFLFLGVLRYYKGLDLLLKAAVGSPQSFVIAGSGPMEGELRDLAGKLGLKNVHFVGIVSEQDKTSLMHLSRALIFPSQLRSEAFGMSLLEGAMFGKPLISVEIGTGTSYINRHGETGLVVPAADPEALRRAVASLAADPGLAAACGSRARLRFLELFTAERYGREYLALYNRCLGR